MLDIGFAELLLLSVVGLMVLGPERLPKVARTLGGLAHKARSSWSNLKRSIDAELQAEEFKKPLDDLKKAKDAITQPIGDLKKPFEDFQKDLKKSADSFVSKANEEVNEQSSETQSKEGPKEGHEETPESATKPGTND